MYSGASEIAREVDAAFYWIGGICVALLIGITAVMVYFVIRYRRARSPQAAHIEGSLPLEIGWIVVPTILVLFMFFKGYEGFKLMRTVPEDAQVVEVVGQRWFWTFIYPEQGITSDRLYAPVGKPMKLEMTAPVDDVVHSLYLPAFRVKEDCVPGRKSYLWFQPEQEGRYHIFCAEYCGKDHSRMITELVVLSPEKYQAWLQRKVEDRNKPVVMAQAMDPESAEIKERDGAALFKTYCVSCHGAEGLGGLVENARNFTSLADWKRSPKITDIYRTLELGIEGTQMRSFSNLPPWDRFALAHHVAAFYKGSDRPQASPEEVEQLNKDFRLGEKQEPRRTIPIEQAKKAYVEDAGGG